MTWATYAIGFSGTYLVVLAAMFETPNVRSTIAFKAIPSLCGFVLLIIAVAQWRGWPL